MTMVSVLFLACYTLALLTPCSTQMTDEMRVGVLQAHNELRLMTSFGYTRDKCGKTQPPASNMQRLFWSSELESEAQKKANGCLWEHSSYTYLYAHEVGENLAMFPSPDKSAEDMSKMWFVEIGKDCPNATEYAKFATKFQKGKGHYAQAVWAETNHIGCGYKYPCPNPIQENGLQMAYLVCQYKPWGNIFGRSIYKASGRVCEDCPSGMKCYNDQWLCEPIRD